MKDKKGFSALAADLGARVAGEFDLPTEVLDRALPEAAGLGRRYAGLLTLALAESARPANLLGGVQLGGVT